MTEVSLLRRVAAFGAALVAAFVASLVALAISDVVISGDPLGLNSSQFGYAVIAMYFVFWFGTMPLVWLGATALSTLPLPDWSARKVMLLGLGSAAPALALLVVGLVDLTLRDPDAFGAAPLVFVPIISGLVGVWTFQGAQRRPPKVSPQAENLRGWWRRLSTDVDLGDALIAAYDEPQRRYHGLGHVRWLLQEQDRRRALILDSQLVQYAIWFHDAVYDPRAPDNEERSADWARRALASKGDLADRVATLILKTRHHADGEASADEALFLDMDIAILGAPGETYARYADDIRAEYAHVADEAFRSGRGGFLKAQLARPRVFRTDLYETELGAAARTNMAWELARLEAGA